MKYWESCDAESFPHKAPLTFLSSLSHCNSDTCFPILDMKLVWKIWMNLNTGHYVSCSSFQSFVLCVYSGRSVPSLWVFFHCQEVMRWPPTCIGKLWRLQGRTHGDITISATLAPTPASRWETQIDHVVSSSLFCSVVIRFPESEHGFGGVNAMTTPFVCTERASPSERNIC